MRGIDRSINIIILRATSSGSFSLKSLSLIPLLKYDEDCKLESKEQFIVISLQILKILTLT